MYHYAGGSEAAQMTLHGRIWFLDQLIHMTCDFERFCEDSRDQRAHLKKKLTSRRD